MSMNTPPPHGPTEPYGQAGPQGAPPHAYSQPPMPMPMPPTQKPQRKSVFKRWWFWLIIGFVVVVGIMAAASDDGQAGTDAPAEQSQNSADKPEKSEDKPKKEAEESSAKDDDKADDPDVSREFKAALASAQTYADTLHMSKKGIYDQLVSEHGESFPKDAAQYAIDNVEADWKENALKTAENYQDTMNMSRDAIREQLVSEYGEQFTEEEADYAMEHLPE